VAHDRHNRCAPSLCLSDTPRNAHSPGDARARTPMSSASVALARHFTRVKWRVRASLFNPVESRDHHAVGRLSLERSRGRAHSLRQRAAERAEWWLNGRTGRGVCRSVNRDEFFARRRSRTSAGITHVMGPRSIFHSLTARRAATTRTSAGITRVMGPLSIAHSLTARRAATTRTSHTSHGSWHVRWKQIIANDGAQR